MGTSTRADCNDLTLGPTETSLLKPGRSGKLPCSLRRDEPCPFISLWPARLSGMVVGIILGWLLRCQLP